MAKLFNTAIEAVALRSMCSKDLKASGAILTRLDESHFYTDEGKEAYARILALFQRKGEPPNFRLLCQDGGLTEDTREFLKSAEGVAKSPGQIDQLLGSLNEYRQTRLYYSLARKLLKRLEAPTINPDELSELVSGIISKIQLKRSAEADIIHIGKDSNVREALEELIYGENQDNCIPTGFKTFDTVNGGFFRGSLVTLGGTSGAGKSILANQLNINQASIGYKTSLVPLEMSTQEMLARSTSSVSGQSSIDIFLKRLATGEKDSVWKKFTRFDRKVAKANGRYTIFKPREDMSIEELMAALHTFNSDVTYIDYISLLKGADGDDQWRKLGQIARFGKIHAENTNRVVVMLAQINEEGKLRYSQAVKEHSSLAWTFVATKESKERGYLNIELLKSRNQVDRPFTLGIDYAQMKVRDLQPDELQKIDAVDKKKADGKKVGATAKGGKTSDYIPDLTE